MFFSGDTTRLRPPRLLALAAAAGLVTATWVIPACGRADARPAPEKPSAPAKAPGLAVDGGGAGGGGGPAAGAAQRDVRTLGTEEIRSEMQRAKGHALFVHLWASWCAPCLEELPVMDRFARRARARGAVVLSVSLDTGYEGVARIPALLQARAPNLTAIVAHFEDADRFIALFSKSWEGNIPALFAFDRAGKLQRGVIGGLTPEELDALTSELVGPATKPPVR